MRLPVVDPDGKLIGIVSRCDLLSVFLRPGESIAREVELGHRRRRRPREQSFGDPAPG